MHSYVRRSVSYLTCIGFQSCRRRNQNAPPSSAHGDVLTMQRSRTTSLSVIRDAGEYGSGRLENSSIGEQPVWPKKMAAWTFVNRFGDSSTISTDSQVDIVLGVHGRVQRLIRGIRMAKIANGEKDGSPRMSQPSSWDQPLSSQHWLSSQQWTWPALYCGRHDLWCALG